jgi:hypothetical protein
MAQSNVIVKLSLKDAEVVRKGLQALRADGEKALKRIDAAGRAPSAGLRRSALRPMSSRASSATSAARSARLAAFCKRWGRAGWRAAAGIGALALGLLKAMNAGRQAIDDFSRLNDAATRLGMNVEDFQAFSAAALTIGVSAEHSEKAISKLNDLIGQVLQDGADAPKKSSRRSMRWASRWPTCNSTATISTGCWRPWPKANALPERLQIGKAGAQQLAGNDPGIAGQGRDAEQDIRCRLADVHDLGAGLGVRQVQRAGAQVDIPPLQRQNLVQTAAR